SFDWHVVRLHLVTQVPIWHTLSVPSAPGGQEMPWQGSATQKPMRQRLPAGHGNSPTPHGWAHWQSTHDEPVGHSEPPAGGLSTVPSQSSSRQLQVSGLGPTYPMHWKRPATHFRVPA